MKNIILDKEYIDIDKVDFCEKFVCVKFGNTWYKIVVCNNKFHIINCSKQNRAREIHCQVEMLKTDIYSYAREAKVFDCAKEMYIFLSQLLY